VLLCTFIYLFLCYIMPLYFVTKHTFSVYEFSSYISSSWELKKPSGYQARKGDKENRDFLCKERSSRSLGTSEALAIGLLKVKTCKKLTDFEQTSDFQCQEPGLFLRPRIWHTRYDHFTHFSHEYILIHFNSVVCTYIPPDLTSLIGPVKPSVRKD